MQCCLYNPSLTLLTDTLYIAYTHINGSEFLTIAVDVKQNGERIVDESLFVDYSGVRWMIVLDGPIMSGRVGFYTLPNTLILRN